MIKLFLFVLQATAANFADLNKLFNSGMECGVTSMTINSKKYFIIRADKEDKTVEGKCGPGGFCAAKGETCKCDLQCWNISSLIFIGFSLLKLLCCSEMRK